MKKKLPDHEKRSVRFWTNVTPEIAEKIEKNSSESASASFLIFRALVEFFKK